MTGTSDVGAAAKSLEVWIPGEAAPLVDADGLSVEDQRKVPGGWLVALRPNASTWSLTITSS